LENLHLARKRVAELEAEVKLMEGGTRTSRNHVIEIKDVEALIHYFAGFLTYNGTLMAYQINADLRKAHIQWISWNSNDLIKSFDMECTEQGAASGFWTKSDRLMKAHYNITSLCGISKQVILADSDVFSVIVSGLVCESLTGWFA